MGRQASFGRGNFQQSRKIEEPSRHTPALPLFTVADAQQALKTLRPHPFGATTELHPGLQLTYHRQGHILGAGSVVLRYKSDGGRSTLVFSGDVGRYAVPILRPPEPYAGSTYLVLESTYGNRLHKTLATTYDELAQVLAATLPRGNVIIPAFAVGRTQEVLHVLADLVRQGRTPALNIFVDSPLATRATEITIR